MIQLYLKGHIISLFIWFQISIRKTGVCRIDGKFASFPFIAYIYYKILVDLTLIRQGDVIHVLTRKNGSGWPSVDMCIVIYMKNYKESKIYNIIKYGILNYL